ncbi:MAG: tetratricopeptide repeat protein [Gemmatimonadota bacterium]|nr:tetratricopeptide repeat protein [Gemmatimonadota bacterium]
MTIVPAVVAAQDATLQQGAKLFEQGRYAEAKQILIAAQRTAPTADGAYYLGRIAFAENDANAAVASLENAVKLEPKSSRAYGWLGRAYTLQLVSANKLRQLSLAGRVRGAFETAVALDPDNSEARYDLVRFFLTAPGLAGGSMDRARQHAAELAKHSPMYGHFAAAMIAEKDRDAARATSEWEAAAAAAPDSGAAYFNLASYYRRAKLWDEAWRTLDRYAARRPDDPELAYHVGSTGAQSGRQVERAERALRAYLARPWRPGTPTFSSAHLHLGELLERRGDRDGARREYQMALQLNPKNNQAKTALDHLG